MYSNKICAYTNNFLSLKVGLANIIIPLIQYNSKQMEVGTIVFAFLNQHYWPGKIISWGLMAQVKIYKLKTVIKVPTKTLHLFSPEKMPIFMKNQDKIYLAAMKMAHKQYLETQKYEEQNFKKKDFDQGGISKMENLEPQKQQTPQFKNEVMKKEEEDDKNQYEIVGASSFMQFVQQMNELELIQESKENKPRQFCFFNTVTRQQERYTRQPRYVLAILTETLMRKVRLECSKSKTLPLQKKAKNILLNWNVDIRTILHTDMWRLINLTIRRREQMPWITNSYIQAIVNFKQKVCGVMSNYLDDYSEIGVLWNRAPELYFK